MLLCGLPCHAPVGGPRPHSESKKRFVAPPPRLAHCFVGLAFLVVVLLLLCILQLRVGECATAEAKPFPAFVVSLESAARRRATLLASFDGRLDPTFVTAVTGSDVLRLVRHGAEGVPAIKSRRGATAVRGSTDWRAALACSVSHLRAMRAGIESSAPYALVVEDDVVSDLLHFWPPDQLSRFIKALPRDWGVVQVALSQKSAHWDKQFAVWAASSPPPLAMPPVTHFNCAAAYLISRASMLYAMGQYGVGDLFGFENKSTFLMDAVEGVLASAPPPGKRLYVATPPLFTWSSNTPSQIVDDPANRRGLPLSASANVTFQHSLSRTLALHWNAVAAQRRVLGEEAWRSTWR